MRRKNHIRGYQLDHDGIIFMLFASLASDTTSISSSFGRLRPESSFPCWSRFADARPACTVKAQQNGISRLHSIVLEFTYVDDYQGNGPSVPWPKNFPPCSALVALTIRSANSAPPCSGLMAPGKPLTSTPLLVFMSVRTRPVLRGRCIGELSVGGARGNNLPGWYGITTAPTFSVWWWIERAK